MVIRARYTDENRKSDFIIKNCKNLYKQYRRIFFVIFIIIILNVTNAFADNSVYVPSDVNGPGMLNFDNANANIASTSVFFNDSDFHVDKTKIAPVISTKSELMIAKYTHIPYSYKARLVAIVEKGDTPERLCKWIAREVHDQEMADYRETYFGYNDIDSSIDPKFIPQIKADEEKIKMFEYQDLIEDLLNMICEKYVINDDRRVKLSYMIKGQEPDV